MCSIHVHESTYIHIIIIKPKAKQKKNYIKNVLLQYIQIITGTLQLNLHVNWSVYSYDDRFWMRV